MSLLRFTTPSWLRRAHAACGIALLASLVACGGGDAASGGDQTPQIVAAPADRQAIVGQLSTFSVEGLGAGLAFAWEEQPGGSGDWRASSGNTASDGFASNLVIGPVDIGMDKTRFRSRVSNAAGAVLGPEARLDVVWGTVSTLEPNAIDFGPGAGGLGGADGGSPGGGDGEGAGVGGGLGKTPRAVITVTRVADGATLGSAPAGATSGLVRVKAGPGTVPVIITLKGASDASYYDEGRDTTLPLAPDQQLNALVLSFDRHLGVTTLTEAAYRYALNHFLQDPAAVRAGTVPLKRTATPQEIAQLTPTQIQLANEAIRNEINRLLPPRYALDSISTLPTPVDNTSPQGSVTDNIYGRMQAVVGGLSLAAARFEPSLANPALTMNAQLVDDLSDGVVDGQALDQRTVFGPAGTNAYLPDSLPQLLADAADDQVERFGDGTIQQPPVITLQPRAAEITAGGTARLQVNATGSLLTFQWYLNGTAIPGATRAEYSASLPGEYYVEVGNGAGMAASERVRVTLVTATVAPVITAQPIPATVTSGDSTTFSVQASGTDLRYQWQIVPSPGIGRDIAGATSSSWTTGTAGTYRVVVSNSAGSASSQDATLTVTERVTAPRITRQPTSQVVIGGQAVTLRVEASGNPLEFQWYRDGAPITNANASNYTTSTAGTYHVVVLNTAGRAESDRVAVSAVMRPTITTQPVSATINQGQEHTFSVIATGTDLKYQWYVEGEGPESIAGATSASYTTREAGDYSVVVYNDADRVRSTIARLTVRPVEVPASSFEIYCGQTTATLGVTATIPSPRYQWQLNGSPIAGANGPSYLASVAGTYTVIVSNAAGSTTSNAMVVSCIPAPVITAHPVSAQVTQGATHTFSVTATGRDITYQWQLVPAVTAPIDIPNATGSTYATATAGTYRVVVRNPAGAMTSNSATLTVAALPEITEHPQSASLPNGSTHTMAVSATGTGLQYQWQQSVSGRWEPITDATGTAYTTAESGTFRVEVRNAVGPVNSNAAEVRIGAGSPVITGVAVICPDSEPCQWVVTATGATPMTWQWYQVYNGGASNAVPGATAPNYAPPILGTFYYVVVRNSAGTTTSPTMMWRY